MLTKNYFFCREYNTVQDGGSQHGGGHSGHNNINNTNIVSFDENIRRTSSAADGGQKRSHSRSATESRTPSPKMLLDVKSGAIHWPVYQFGGKTGSGMLLSTQALVVKKKVNSEGKKEEPGRENFSLGEQFI
jgi:hypothetical protein